MTQLTELVGRQLPRNPSLNALKREAKAILKSHSDGEMASCGILRRIHRFEGKTDETILAEKVSLVDVQFALAMDYGFRSWQGLLSFLGFRKPRTAERLSDAYRVSYRIESQGSNEKLFPYSDLTLGENIRNSFHNELSSLLAFTGMPGIPDLLDYDPETLTLTIEDLGVAEPLRRVHADGCLSRLASLHHGASRRTPELRRNWFGLWAAHDNILYS